MPETQSSGVLAGTTRKESRFNLGEPPLLMYPLRSPEFDLTLCCPCQALGVFFIGWTWGALLTRVTCRSRPSHLASFEVIFDEKDRGLNLEHIDLHFSQTNSVLCPWLLAVWVGFGLANLQKQPQKGFL